jgi:hypothetical protein
MRKPKSRKEEQRMNCQSFDELVSELAKDSLDEAMRKDALSHSATCTECLQKLHQQTLLSNMLQEYRNNLPKHSSKPSDELLSRFRERKLKRPAFYRSWYFQAAAIFIFGLVGGILYKFGTAPIDLKVPTAFVSTKTNTGSAWKVGEEPIRYANREITTEFIPLFDNGAMNPARMVRVKMNRDALMQLGLSMPETRSKQPIVADVLLSEEGTPQAIRFVQTVSFH